jgi:hypothetical protein
MTGGGIVLLVLGVGIASFFFANEAAGCPFRPD